MRRTNVYLDEKQLHALDAVSKSRGEPIAALIRRAIDAWLIETNGASPTPIDVWQQRFDVLLDRRSRIARRTKPSAASVEGDVGEAVDEARSARRR